MADNLAQPSLGTSILSLNTGLREVEYLLDAIDRAAETAEGVETLAERLKAIDAVVVLTRLAKAAITGAQLHAESIEIATLQRAGRA